MHACMHDDDICTDALTAWSPKEKKTTLAADEEDAHEMGIEGHWIHMGGIFQRGICLRGRKRKRGKKIRGLGKILKATMSAKFGAVPWELNHSFVWSFVFVVCFYSLRPVPLKCVASTSAGERAEAKVRERKREGWGCGERVVQELGIYINHSGILSWSWFEFSITS